jgi:hypothetical protein
MPLSVDPATLKQILDSQSSLVNGLQKSYENLRAQEVKENVGNKNLEDAVLQMHEQQKLILELLKNKQQPDNSGKIVELLEKMSHLLANPAAPAQQSSAYNKTDNAKSHTDISKFEERYVPKVDDFDGKNSNITTSKTTSGNTDAALEALRKLKGK